MEIHRLFPSGSPLTGLLQQSKLWQMLDAEVKTRLPENLHGYCKAVCIDENGALILYAYAPMAAARLKMLQPALLSGLQQKYSHIRTIRIKVRPQQKPAARQKNFRISPRAAEHFLDTADRLAHHPDLAAAMRCLAHHHLNTDKE